jgi:hypothetical protein
VGPINSSEIIVATLYSFGTLSQEICINTLHKADGDDNNNNNELYRKTCKYLRAQNNSKYIDMGLYINIYSCTV